jgi:hypothetical protein
MSKFGDDLIQGMTEAVAFARGDKAGARVHVVELPDVRAIRLALHHPNKPSLTHCGTARGSPVVGAPPASDGADAMRESWLLLSPRLLFSGPLPDISAKRPDTKAAFIEIAAFFDSHLAN